MLQENIKQIKLVKPSTLVKEEFITTRVDKFH